MGNKMPTSIRLTKDEQKLIHEKTIEVNKKLMAMNQMPMQESELVHAVLELALRNTAVSSDAEITISKSKA